MKINLCLSRTLEIDSFARFDNDFLNVILYVDFVNWLCLQHAVRIRSIISRIIWLWRVSPLVKESFDLIFRSIFVKKNIIFGNLRAAYHTTYGYLYTQAEQRALTFAWWAEKWGLAFESRKDRGEGPRFLLKQIFPNTQRQLIELYFQQVYQELNIVYCKFL